MCVMGDAPNSLLEGTEELPRYENELALLPSWLNWLTKINLIRTISSFAVQFWFYEQIANIGREGKPDDDLTVFSATLKQQKAAGEWMKQRHG